MRTTAASAVVLILSFFSISLITEDFQVFTKEQARRLNVSRIKPMLPATRMLDQRGNLRSLHSWVIEEKKLMIVDFIYTRCNTVCLSLGNEFQQLQELIRSRNMQERVTLLSITFDPLHDTPKKLADYASRLKADENIWRFATVKDTNDLDGLLQFFMVTVINDEFGGYQHNAALLGVRPDGRLHSIADSGSGRHQEILDLWLKASFPSDY